MNWSTNHANLAATDKVAQHWHCLTTTSIIQLDNLEMEHTAQKSNHVTVLAEREAEKQELTEKVILLERQLKILSRATNMDFNSMHNRLMKQSGFVQDDEQVGKEEDEEEAVDGACLFLASSPCRCAMYHFQATALLYEVRPVQ
jgi:hypothetical protein